MENNVFIQTGKTEHFEFQLAVHGLSGQDSHVRFVLHSEPFHMMFPCTHSNGDTWTLELPSMPWLDPTTYKFTLEAIVDGYYFPAHEGTLTVSKSPEVYVKKSDATMKVRSSSPVATPKTFDTAVAKTEEPVVKPETETTTKDDNFKNIIDRLKKPVVDPDASKKEEEVVVKAEKKEDKKEDAKKEDSKDVKESDPLAKAREVADKVLIEDTATPTAKKPKTSAKKAERSASDIIREHQEEQRRKKELELQRKQLAESRRQKAIAAEKKKAEVKNPEPITEKVEMSEKDLAAKAILEAAKKVDEPAPKNAIFKKGNTVTK